MWKRIRLTGNLASYIRWLKLSMATFQSPGANNWPSCLWHWWIRVIQTNALKDRCWNLPSLCRRLQGGRTWSVARVGPPQSLPDLSSPSWRPASVSLLAWTKTSAFPNVGGLERTEKVLAAVLSPHLVPRWMSPFSWEEESQLPQTPPVLWKCRVRGCRQRASPGKLNPEMPKYFKQKWQCTILCYVFQQALITQVPGGKVPKGKSSKTQMFSVYWPRTAALPSSLHGGPHARVPTCPHTRLPACTSHPVTCFSLNSKSSTYFQTQTFTQNISEHLQGPARKTKETEKPKGPALKISLVFLSGDMH